MNSVTEAVLERHTIALDPPRDQHDLLVLDVDALDVADALGEAEDLGLGERRGGEPARIALPDDRRVQALLDDGPDRERRREVVTSDGHVGTVTDPDLVDAIEEDVGGVPGEHVRHARLDAHADQREQPTVRPLTFLRELQVAELHPHCSYGCVGCGDDSDMAMST